MAAICGEYVPPWQLDPDLRGADMRITGFVESGIRKLQTLEGIGVWRCHPGRNASVLVRSASNWARRQSNKADNRMG